MAEQCYTAFKNVQPFGSIFLASATVDVFETDKKAFMVRAQCFPFYQLAPSLAVTTTSKQAI
jgi:hypothetical protein